MAPNEKIALGNLLSRYWTCPGSTLNVGIIGSICVSIGGAAVAIATGKRMLAPIPLLAILGLYEIKHRNTPAAPLQSKYITFKSKSAKKRWGGRKIPIGTLTTLFLDDEIEFNMDVLEALESMDDFCCYMPSWPVLKFLLMQLYPNSNNSSLKDKKTTKREIADHYDRGNDFFNAFLGPRMVYTSAVFEKEDVSFCFLRAQRPAAVAASHRHCAYLTTNQSTTAAHSLIHASTLHPPQDTLESAQDNKMRKICEKLRLKQGDRMLDIGCGWGTLVGYAYKHFQASATGVTLSKEGAKWSADNNKPKVGPPFAYLYLFSRSPSSSRYVKFPIRKRAAFLLDLTRLTYACRSNVAALQKPTPGKGSVDFIVTDYRDIPDGEKFNAISSVEMAEHVGLANFQTYLNKVKTNLEDDGAFYMQVAGLRKGSDWKDIAWGLFMGEYIFPGADASTPLNWYINELEQAGLEVESIENVGINYSLTLNEWYKNWMKNEHEIIKKYPSSLCRLWRLFLAWSTLASRRGSATCWMITSHKVTDKFDRSKMIAASAGQWQEAAKFARFKATANGHSNGKR